MAIKLYPVKTRPGMKKKIKRNIDNLRKQFPPQEYPIVLDVGAREGYAVYWLRKYGYDALGMETEKKYCSPIILHGNFLEERLREETYNIVLSRHSLEHIELENEDGTERFLNNCHQILCPGGILYLIVPISQWWEFYCGTKKRGSNGFEYLSTLIKSAGFDIIKERNRENALFVCRKK